MRSRRGQESGNGRPIVLPRKIGAGVIQLRMCTQQHEDVSRLHPKLRAGIRIRLTISHHGDDVYPSLPAQMALAQRLVRCWRIFAHIAGLR